MTQDKEGREKKEKKKEKRKRSVRRPLCLPIITRCRALYEERLLPRISCDAKVAAVRLKAGNFH